MQYCRRAGVFSTARVIGNQTMHDAPAFGPLRSAMCARSKSRPARGATGRVGCDTGVDEAPVPDAGSTHCFSRPSVAAAHAADVVAVGVELANPAAAAIAVIVVAIIRGDRAADHGGADQTGSDGPAGAERLGFGCGGGGRDAAGNGKGGESERGNSGLDRHEKLHPVERGPAWSECPVGRGLFKFGSGATALIRGNEHYFLIT